MGTTAGSCPWFLYYLKLRRTFSASHPNGFDALPYSMTGFASVDAAAPPFRLAWELRSVNHRFLDLSLRLPEELRALEP
ncbi:MAG TPA: YicC/YloC family endoribonuclease, partial [Gammaproteobacteria bacterium]|nr:YicC/YloC family endoribonuclease [Gammaproteobacteria bacterium]